MKSTIKGMTIIATLGLLLTACGTTQATPEADTGYTTGTVVQEAPVVTVAWWPADYQQFDDTIAFKAADSNCDYFDCFTYDVISKEACENFYVEMTYYDDANANLGYSNDVATAVAPMQVVKMRFDVLDDSVTQGAITSVSCR